MYRQSFHLQLCGLLIACLMLPAGSFAQMVYSQFMAHYEGGDVEYGYGVCQAPDGNFTVCGNIGFGPGGSDACITHLDPAGTQLWTLAYGGPSGEDARAIAVTRDSGYIFVGQTGSFGSGGTDVLVAKLDRFGQVQWARAIGGTGNDYGTAVDTTSDGGYIVGGYTRSFGSGNNDAYFIKLSAAGALQWTRVVGGTQAELIYDVVETSTGGYAGGGYTVTFGAPGTDYYLILLDAGGNLTNTVTYGGNNSDNGFGMINTSDGGFMLYGFTSGFGTGGNEGMLIKTDLTGGVTWAYTYGTAAMDRIFHVVETADGDFIATGETTTNTFGAGDQQFIKVDNSGTLLWARHYGTPVDETGYGASVATTDGGVILAAWDDNDEDFLVTKTDSMGDSGCNNALSTLNVTTPALAIGSGGFATTGGTATNIVLPVAPNPLTEISYCATILPVGEVELTADHEAGYNYIRWELMEPELISRIELERSEDGHLFAAIHAPGQVRATANYRDPAAPGSVHFYRLRLSDANGGVYYSRVRRVISDAGGLDLSWSFAGEALQARRVDGMVPDREISWQLIDLQGKVLARDVKMAAGEMELSLPRVPAGTYLIRVRQGANVASWRILRQ
jgi:hypothetical protein